MIKSLCVAALALGPLLLPAGAAFAENFETIGTNMQGVIYEVDRDTIKHNAKTGGASATFYEAGQAKPVRFDCKGHVYDSMGRSVHIPGGSVLEAISQRVCQTDE